MSDDDQNPSEEAYDPRLTEEDRRILARMRREVAEAKAAGRWQTAPPDEGDDKFSGPFGVDKDGHVLIYDTDEEARRALEEHERAQRRSVEEQLRERTEGP